MWCMRQQQDLYGLPAAPIFGRANTSQFLCFNCKWHSVSLNKADVYVASLLEYTIYRNIGRQAGRLAQTGICQLYRAHLCNGKMIINAFDESKSIY